ncbi:hypothetical protein ACWGCW_24770 [Streptomyces sp. NPDC054933]
MQQASTGFLPNWSQEGFEHQTVRQIVRVTSGGSAVRIHLSNLYGSEPLAGGTHRRPGDLPRAGVRHHVPWIRDSGTFDAVVDFAAALAAPGNPERLNPLWDSGDHKHPDDAGYRTMADRAALALE